MPINHFVGNLSPSLSDTIKVNGVAFDLTNSTVNFRMRAEGSSTLLVDSPAVVVSAPAGTVRYDWAAPDVATAGEYLAWWHVVLPSTKVQDTLEFLVTMVDHLQATRYLCELEDVTSFAPGYVADPTTDSILRQLIGAKSREWHQQTGREFAAINPALPTRRFDISDWAVLDRKIRIGDMAQTPSAVTFYDFDQVTVTRSVLSTDYVLTPRVREEWEPITGIMFPWFTPNAPWFLSGQVLEVTSSGWGFPATPLDVREAVAGMVIYDYLTKVAESGTAFAEAINYGAVNVGALYARGQTVLGTYALPGIG